MEAFAAKALTATVLAAAALTAAVLAAGPAWVLAADPAASPGAVATASAGAPASPAPDSLDLAAVVLGSADLPAGFEVSDQAVSSFTSLAHALAGSLQTSPGAGDVNPAVLQRTVGRGAEFVTVVLVSPLSPGDQAAFDASVQQSERLVREAIGDSFGQATVTPVTGMRTGISRFAIAISAPDIGVEYQAVAARRGPVIEVIGHAWTQGVTPATSLAAVASILDARLAAAVGVGAPVFRPAGPLVPELTTHIPSPLDVSTDPAVLGTNLVLSALALLMLTVSSKLATRMLAEHEEAIERRVPLAGLVGRAEARIGAAVGGRLGGRRAGGAITFVGVTLFYGLVFSLLEPSWEPLSLTGVWLLLSMTVANAVVGMADDLVAWRAARRWALPAGLVVRPTSALVAMASVGLSRVAALVPGLMFGTPEALRLDESALDEAHSRRLAVIGVVTLVAVGGTAWAITIATTGLARAGELTVLLAGIEALLLLVFASALQNLFVALLGLRGSAGDLLRTRSPVAWGAALVAVTFLFFHTLLNPQGDPAAALGNRNVQVTLGIVVGFSVAVVATWAILRLVERSPAQADGPATASPETPPAVSGPVPRPAPGPVTTTMADPAAPIPLPGPAAVPPPVTVLAGVAAVPGASAPEAVIGTADGSARGRASFRFVDGWVVATTQLVDPRARRQLRAFAVLSAAGWMVPFGAWAMVREAPSNVEVFVAGFLGIAAAWLAAVVVARLWMERYTITETAVIPVLAVGATRAGRDWNLGCALAIVLSPLVAILYLLFARGRVLRVTAPFAADRPGPVTLRLKGSEAEARYLEQLLAAAHAGGPGGRGA